jgi:hypothetical protein
MPLEVKKVESPSDLKKFVIFPWSVYDPESLWVPPLISERIQFLNRSKNPFFNQAEVDYYLAVDGEGKTVGRIAFILDHHHNEYQKDLAGFFGMFECVDDSKVANLLLDTVFAQCKSKGLTRMMGPMNLSTNHECGLLVEGFDTPPMIGMPFNPPHYTDFFDNWGLSKAKDLVSLKFTPTEIPEYLVRAMGLVTKRNRFTLRCLDMDRFDEELKTIWEVYNSAWSRNWGFVPMTRDEFIFSAKDMKSIVNPELCLIAEIKGEAVGFALTLPNVNQILKPLNGRLLPFGWLKFILNKKKIDTWRIVTLGVKKECQKLGIDVAFFHEIYRLMLVHNLRMAEMSWILEDNQAMIKPIQRVGGTLYKKHRIYERACQTE